MQSVIFVFTESNDSASNREHLGMLNFEIVTQLFGGSLVPLARETPLCQT